MSPVRPEKLDQRITIEVMTRTRDPKSGEWLVSWSRLGNVWAELAIGRHSLAKYFSAQQVSQVQSIWRLRLIGGAGRVLTPDKHRIRQGYQTHAILETFMLSREELLVLTEARGEGVTASGDAPNPAAPADPT